MEENMNLPLEEVEVVDIQFRPGQKIYYFDPDGAAYFPGDHVIMDTARGAEYGIVTGGNHKILPKEVVAPLRKVLRKANAQDEKIVAENRAKEKKAYDVCLQKIAEHNLDMQLVSAEVAFDGSKILFYFTANGRVDFRSLVKDLAGVFKTRIELRQIGVRDEAKMLGGLGVCGRPICCGTFLGDFQPVSIKMAKEQNLSLNPTKISGVCGRLMCCLKYEQDQYEQTRKKMPKVGKEVITPDGPGVVWDLNIIKETVRVRIQKGDSSELKDFPMDEVQRPGAANTRKEEPAEIPEVEEAAEEAAEEKAEKPAEEQSRRKERPQREERSQREERKPRREEGDKEGQKERREERKPRKEERRPKPENHEAKPVEKPAEKPEEKPAEPVKATEAEQKPAANSWKAALERAMQEAGNTGK